MKFFISEIEGNKSHKVTVEAEDLDLADEAARRYFSDRDLVRPGDVVRTTQGTGIEIVAE